MNDNINNNFTTDGQININTADTAAAPADEANTPVRLQKLLAQSGAGSRRYCEALIRGGRVTVDGIVVKDMGVKVIPGARIEINGAPVLKTDAGDSGIPYIYLLLNKPPGVITSSNDQFGRKTVVDLIKDNVSRRVFPVGRLDYNTSGMIILTDDGDFAYRATHPKFGVEKVYTVYCGAPPGESAIGRLRNGVKLPDGYVTSPTRVYTDINNPLQFTIVLREARNRQVRKMADAVGCAVEALARVAIGGLAPDGLSEGQWRYLSRDEANLIFCPYAKI
jgi:23S rRNA pseudouridine2605 synthase